MKLPNEPDINLLRTVVMQLVAAQPQPTPQSIREAIGQCRQVPSFNIPEEVAEQLARQIEEQLDITMTLGAVVQEEFAEWYDAAKPSIDPYYWSRYKQLLNQKQLAPQVIAKLDQVTDRIAGLLGNPQKAGSWDRRGMVVGHVQSGKTANYTGLICKAADAGYKLIIVVAGIHNSLRNQTQQRIDEGFVGRDSARLARNKQSRVVGVGRFDAMRLPLTVTTAVQDFNKSAAEAFGVQLKSLTVPAVLVIKKNSNTLKNVISWLKEHNSKGGSALVEAPMLLIDDEADNASINVSRNPEEASRINRQMRELLNLFQRKCYVGYTATPFANIFIDPDTDDEMLKGDLFPSDFIVALDPPSNYFGALRIFGPEREKNILREITDDDAHLPIKHTTAFQFEKLPPSLEKAVRTFILVRAVRLLRGQAREHNSMLINASRFTAVQKQIRDAVHEFLTQIVTRIRFLSGLTPQEALRDEDMKALQVVWKEEFADSGFIWEEVQARLLEAAAPIRVEEINSRSAGSLAYSDHEEHGLNVIAVGGFSLSRGLTLEGLTVSYFLRNSVMYDTLLQMGRWFGYRAGYEDLCRIWMQPDAIGWYEHITESIEELREELRRMEQANLTPKDFGLKVRSHPDTLIVTARNKMGTSKEVRVSIGLSDKLIETTWLLRSNAIRANREHTKRFTDALKERGAPQRPESNYFWTGVPAEAVVGYISGFQHCDISMQTKPAPVCDFIRAGAGDELKTWDVAVISVGEEHATGEADESLGLSIRCQRRTRGAIKTRSEFAVSSRRRVSSQGIERLGLDEAQLKEAQAQYRKDKEIPDGQTPNYPDSAYRRFRPRPLLMIHLLLMFEPRKDTESAHPLEEEPVVAWGISFPPTPETNRSHRTVEYVVNTTWWRENYGDDADEELEQFEDA
ncbi:MAG: endonuclease [Mesorhizobium sp.]|uniref:Z1 domain-containing protein n=1 Tax=Mesorhizobium sp. TaxID=1871066 RepID=UPI000FE71655|nr:Z1 domain-containing protein [Mesorhizobium sp.]RWO32340.1 MAG: endonuclease [Mesorhizobium sp.]